jgi:plasmid replication initiation protein
MKNNIVRKSNSLVEASYKLSVNQQKIVLLLASSIKPGDENFQPYQINIKEFAKLLGLKNKNFYGEIDALTSDLRNRELVLSSKQSLLRISWLSSVEYFKGTGVIELCFDPKMKPYLLQLKERFTTYRLKEVIQLKSSFSIRIYELLKQYEKIGERIFLLETLKASLGIGPTEYSLYGDFKRRVLLVAQSEVAEKTDISFKFKEIKEGRKVVKIKFIINSQNTEPTSSTPLSQGLLFQDQELDRGNENLKKLLEILPKVYQDKKSIEKLLLEALEKHGFDYVARNIKYANENSNATKPGANLTKGSNYRNYLAKTLKSDFGLAYQEDSEALQLKEQQAKAKEADQKRRQLSENEKIEQERELAIQAKKILQTMTPEETREIETAAILKLSPEMKKMALENRVTAQFAINKAMEKVIIEKYLVKSQSF